MRIPTYLSPTSIHLWMRDREAFYMRYLRTEKLPRQPQTLPMSIGSSFDAYVKCYIYGAIFGKQSDGDTYHLRTLFESQVEKQNWDWAWENGKLVFDAYRRAGCVSDLMLELKSAIGAPNFEFEIKDTINGVPLLGKPDMFFISKENFRVIYDWKVNGYCAKSLKSPMKGYLKLREEGKLDKIHRDCVTVELGGIKINANMYLEEGSKDWADQVSVYAWLLGEAVGSEEWISGIDQIYGPADRLRFATHRCQVSQGFQQGFFDIAKDLWEIINSDWIFRDLSKADSKGLCSLLEKMEDFDEPGFF